MEQKNLDFQLSDTTSKTNSSSSSFDSEGDMSISQEHPVLPNEDGDIILEPVVPNPYDLTFTCLLLPRFDAHQLSGDIVDCIQEVLEQVSDSFGWKLDFLQIEPRYLQWSVCVSPSISATYVINIIRNHTSLRLFADFPQLKEDHDDDFWAPGYLVFLGAQPHPVEIIDRYISQIRQQQGTWMDE
ncbi:MAG TPA: transposase [Anaerolineales bacterium]|nr:transposase [Anaerolineales bacterium]